AVFIAISVGTIDFLVRLHRRLGEPLGRFLREVVLPPALICVLSGAVAAWVAATIGGGLEPADRAHALWALVGGGIVFGTACVGCLAVTRYVTWGELRDVVRMTVRRAPAGGDEPAREGGAACGHPPCLLPALPGRRNRPLRARAPPLVVPPPRPAVGSVCLPPRPAV